MNKRLDIARIVEPLLHIDSNEEWLRWEPIKDLSGDYTLHSIVDSEMLKIILNEGNNKHSLILLFKNSSSSYQVTKENGYFLNGNNQNHNWPFFKIKNSWYLHYLQELSAEISVGIPFQHFAIIPQGYRLDIMATQEPEIQIIQIKNKE